uniref:Uncharacterized protein n=2 Tax=Cacopsylla melanoneura TaxID=428564 RepID=A0A8D9F3X7_9HEMI
MLTPRTVLVLLMMPLLVNLIIPRNTNNGSNLDPGRKEDSSHVIWTDVDFAAESWRGLKAFIGKDLCLGTQEQCFEFKRFIEAQNNWFVNDSTYYKNNPTRSNPSVRTSCDQDTALGGKTVCWVRDKTTGRTTYEIQFWTEVNPPLSKCRFATPNKKQIDTSTTPNK